MLATGPRVLNSAPHAVLNWSCMLLQVGGCQGCSRINNKIIGAVPVLCARCAETTLEYNTPMDLQTPCFIAKKSRTKQNSIAFGSAPRRETDSQPISHFAKPAASQTETHSLGFLSVADASPSSGGNLCYKASSGRMVMQLATNVLVGGSNPGRANMAPAPPMAVGQPGFNRRPKPLQSAALPLDRRFGPPHCLEPSERKLLTPPSPPPPPPSKK